MSKEYSCYAYLNHSRVLSWSGLENFLYETETIQSFSKNKCIIYIHISMVKKYFTVGIWNFFKQSECILFKKSCLLQKLCFWTVFLKIFYVFLKYCVENDFFFNFMIFLNNIFFHFTFENSILHFYCFFINFVRKIWKFDVSNRFFWHILRFFVKQS